MMMMIITFVLKDIVPSAPTRNDFNKKFFWLYLKAKLFFSPFLLSYCKLESLNIQRRLPPPHHVNSSILKWLLSRLEGIRSCLLRSLPGPCPGGKTLPVQLEVGAPKPRSWSQLCGISKETQGGWRVMVPPPHWDKTVHSFLIPLFLWWLWKEGRGERADVPQGCRHVPGGPLEDSTVGKGWGRVRPGPCLPAPLQWPFLKTSRCLRTRLGMSRCWCHDSGTGEGGELQWLLGKFNP